MTQIPLSKIYAMIDHRRGILLEELEEARKDVKADLCSPARLFVIKGKLDELNNLKEELALVPDTDQIPLGL